MRDGFGRSYEKVVHIIRSYGFGEIEIHDPAREIAAVSGEAVEVVHIGLRIELGNQRAVLLDGSVHHEHVHAAFESGANHFAPFGAVAIAAARASADRCEIFFAVALFEHGLDVFGAEQRAVLGVFDAVEIDAERNDVPFVGLVFAQGSVIADDRTLLTGAAEAHFHRGVVRADIRKINGAMAGAGDARDAGVEGLVQDYSRIGEGGGRERAHYYGAKSDDGQRALI